MLLLLETSPGPFLAHCFSISFMCFFLKAPQNVVTVGDVSRQFQTSKSPKNTELLETLAISDFKGTKNRQTLGNHCFSISFMCFFLKAPQNVVIAGDVSRPIFGPLFFNFVHVFLPESASECCYCWRRLQAHFWPIVFQFCSCVSS